MSSDVTYLPNNDPPEVNEARVKQGIKAFLRLMEECAEKEKDKEKTA
jgi:hypothetical protein